VHDGAQFYTLYLEIHSVPHTNIVDPTVKLWDSVKTTKPIEKNRIKLIEKFLDVICCMRPGCNRYMFDKEREWEEFKPDEMYHQKAGSNNSGVAACLFAQFGPRDLPLKWSHEEVENATLKFDFILANLDRFRPSELPPLPPGDDNRYTREPTETKNEEQDVGDDDEHEDDDGDGEGDGDRDEDKDEEDEDEDKDKREEDGEETDDGDDESKKTVSNALSSPQVSVEQSDDDASTVVSVSSEVSPPSQRGAHARVSIAAAASVGPLLRRAESVGPAGVCVCVQVDKKCRLFVCVCVCAQWAQCNDFYADGWMRLWAKSGTCSKM
jgi:hypothetical protein